MPSKVLKASFIRFCPSGLVSACVRLLQRSQLTYCLPFQFFWGLAPLGPPSCGVGLSFWFVSVIGRVPPIGECWQPLPLALQLFLNQTADQGREGGVDA